MTTPRTKPPAWLVATPRSAALYLTWSNSCGRRRAAWLAAGLGALLAAASVLELSHVPVGLGWLQQHAVAMAALEAIFAAASVARRRARHRLHESRSWLAALPLRVPRRRVESIVLDAAPVALTLLSCMVWSGLAWVVFRAAGISTGPLFSVSVVSVSALAFGGALGFAVPLPLPVAPAPGSRYVPVARGAAGCSLRPGLAPLGHWPIRHGLVRAQPKIMARTLVPVLLAVPLNTTADMALVFVALAAAAAVVFVLATSSTTVTRLAWRWLQPLPVAPAAITRALWPRTCAAMAAAGGLLAWLLWVMGTPFTRAVECALATLGLGSLVAATGLAAAIMGARRAA